MLGDFFEEGDFGMAKPTDMTGTRVFERATPILRMKIMEMGISTTNDDLASRHSCLVLRNFVSKILRIWPNGRKCVTRVS